jgi:hypothetical protein
MATIGDGEDFNREPFATQEGKSTAKLRVVSPGLHATAAAEYVGLGLTRFYEVVNEGLIRGVQPRGSGRVYYPEWELDRFLEQRLNLP